MKRLENPQRSTRPFGDPLARGEAKDRLAHQDAYDLWELEVLGHLDFLVYPAVLLSDPPELSEQHCLTDAPESCQDQTPRRSTQSEPLDGHFDCVKFFVAPDQGWRWASGTRAVRVAYEIHSAIIRESRLFNR